MPVNFVFPDFLEKKKADAMKKGSEKTMRNARSAMASTSVSRYASLTKIAFDEKQMAPNREMRMPMASFWGGGVLVVMVV